jgi:hypothetical protein
MINVGVNPNNADPLGHTNSGILILEVSLYNLLQNGDLRRKEAAARAKCPDLGVESYHAEICVSALTDATPMPDRH